MSHTQDKKQVYECTVLFDASATVDVKAASAEEAANLAMDETEGYQRLCYQCSDSLETGDAIGAIVYLNGELVADTTYKAEEISKLTAERDALRAVNAELVEALEKIAAFRPLTFAECSDAETVIGIADAALAKAKELEGTE